MEQMAEDAMPAQQQQQAAAQDRHDRTSEASSSDMHDSSTSGRREAAEEGLSAQLYGMGGVDTSRMSGAALRSYFAKQLMAPEWLTDIPTDLARNWCV